MPLYEYECETGHRFEKIQKFSDPPITECPTCGKPTRKLMSSPAIQFKGSGWYITDYARKDAPANKGDAKAGSETKADAKSETSESKTEKKSEKKSEKSDSKPPTSQS